MLASVLFVYELSEKSKKSDGIKSFPFSVLTFFVLLRQGAKRVFRGMTECHSVPFEGSTLQCDARKTLQCDAGQSEAEGYDKTTILSFRFHI